MTKKERVEKIEKKLKRLDNKYNTDVDDFHKGIYNGWYEALLWAKNSGLLND